MKKLIILLSILLSTLLAFGQNRDISGGGGGHFMAGVTYVFAKKITDYLQTPSVIGAGYDPSPLGVGAGGEGYGMIGRFSLGGGGFGFSGFNASGSNGSVERSGGGGYFKVGYCFLNKNNSFAMVNVGVGGFGYSLKIKNTTTESTILFNQLEPILAGKEKTYEYGGMLYDISAGLKNVVTHKKEVNEIGGFIVGFDAGCMMGVATGNWEGDDNIQGPPNPDVLFVPYIRMTIGGGKFKFEQ